MPKDSKNKILKIKPLRKGLSIYKTARSPYWYVRLRDPIARAYVVRSTKETSRIEAIDAAGEFADSYHSQANSDHARKKSTSFEHYAKKLMDLQKGASKWSDGDNKLLMRANDGLIVYFGKYDVTKINTGMVRDYLIHLDGNRSKRLAESTKAKHTIIMRKVLALAVEDGVLNVLPVMPKQKTVDTPRHTFTDKEYKLFKEVAQRCANRGDKVRGVRVKREHVMMFMFCVHSFLRPTEGELFGLKHGDIQVKGDPTHLELNVRGGKTGARVSVTMPIAVPFYTDLKDPFKGIRYPADEYVWMPEYPNRRTAINTARRIFNHILKEAGLADGDRKLSPYSLRHYAIQARLRESKGKVNLHTLAKNAGTSVDQLERFYLKKMAPSKELIENLQIIG